MFVCEFSLKREGGKDKERDGEREIESMTDRQTKSNIVTVKKNILDLFFFYKLHRNLSFLFLSTDVIF